MAMNNEAVVIANIPREEKSILGLATTKQLAITGAGVVAGIIAFILVKFILGLFGAPTILCLTVGFLAMGICIVPPTYLAFKYKYSDGVNPVPLYPMYVKLQLDRQADLEYGTYVNYHVNHPDLNRGKVIHITNEGTTPLETEAEED